MGSPTCTRPCSSSKRGCAPSLRFVWALFFVMLLVLLCCSPCQGRMLPAEVGSRVMHFQGGLVLKLSPSPSGYNGGGEAAAAPRGFSRAGRSMRSVPSPGVGH
ncbi:hypothetical protein ZWY2020_044784 [Hordeum vulgare]|nr:hypothetical protein ZWY2020_044784 [Hordeum vulgare]